MPKQLDNEWLLRQAVTDSDRETIRNILAMRDRAIREHTFYTEEGIITVGLGRNLISMRQCAAPASIEVYHEIFRENNHFLLNDFSAEDAKLVLDIGANEGLYALRVANANPSAQIICIEPNPLAFEILVKNLENNRVQNVTPINRAISSDGRAVDMEFVPQIHSIGGAKLREVDRPWLKDDFIHKQKIESVTVGQIFSQHSLENVDILKIDVEGMEDEIVEDLDPVAKRIRRIVVERHSKDLRDIVINRLLSLGFELIYEEDPSFEQYYGDLYFLNSIPGTLQ
jgi:FkbM family methyltransferase